MLPHERIESAIEYVKSKPELFTRVAAVHPDDITNRVGKIPGAAYQLALRLNGLLGQRGLVPRR